MATLAPSIRLNMNYSVAEENDATIDHDETEDI